MESQGVPGHLERWLTRYSSLQMKRSTCKCRGRVQMKNPETCVKLTRRAREFRCLRIIGQKAQRKRLERKRKRSRGRGYQVISVLHPIGVFPAACFCLFHSRLHYYGMMKQLAGTHWDQDNAFLLKIKPAKDNFS